VNGVATHWTRITGDGLVYDGPCYVKHIIFWPDSDADYVDIYDGRDTTSGEKFCRIESAYSITWQIHLGDGVLFGHGIYVDAIDSAVQTTVCFMPVETGGE